MESRTIAAPPRFVAWMVQAVLTGPDGEAIAGDLCEEFAEYVIPAHGVVCARWWYRLQVARSVMPLVVRSWQRASVVRASAVVIASAAAATLPAAALLALRAFVLQQVPLKTTSELSSMFGVVLGSVTVLAVAISLLAAVRLLQSARG